MIQKETVTFKNDFAQEVYEGLNDFPKHLSSKWFYDEIGDKIFQEIMKMPEYYPTRTEYSILEKSQIINAFELDGHGFDLIELGAGDGYKTKVLLDRLYRRKTTFTYKPIDISSNVLSNLEKDLNWLFPEMDVQPLQGKYFEVLDQLKQHTSRKKVIMMLGSNLGNLPHPRAIDFLIQLRKTLNPGDKILMGFDLKKDPEIILPAYNDKEGITARFNKNILRRINRELDANFDLDSFRHVPIYDPETGTAKSYLMSLKDQTVFIKELELNIAFYKWETIHTEISQKYEHEVIEWLCDESGLVAETYFTDENNHFADYILTLKS